MQHPLMHSRLKRESPGTYQVEIQISAHQGDILWWRICQSKQVSYLKILVKEEYLFGPLTFSLTRFKLSYSTCYYLQVTLAEITVCVIVAFIKGLTKGAVAVDSLMQDFANKVERNPILRKYIANRPHDGITKR